MPIGLQQVWVKNLTAKDIPLVELGGQLLLAGVEVDITAKIEGGRWYSDSFAALRALHELPVTSLYQALHSSPPKISVRVVTIERPPVVAP